MNIILKKSLKHFLIATVVIGFHLSLATIVLGNDFEVSAEHAIAIEVQTGKVLYEKDAKKRDGIASMTKLLTAYLVLKEIKQGRLTLSDDIPISDDAYALTQNHALSNFPLDKRHYSVEDLLKATLVASSNSAAIALAEHISGTEAHFVDLMKAQLATWDIHDVKLVNASGLPNTFLKHRLYPGSQISDENEMSAQDVAKMAMHLIEEFPEILLITKEPYVFFDGSAIQSFNHLLPGMSVARETVDGLKTGTTTFAGQCLVTSSIENGMRIITVIMNADNAENDADARFHASDNLLTYVSTTYRKETLVQKGQVIPNKNLDIINGKEKYISVYAEQPISVITSDKDPHQSIKDLLLSSPTSEAPIERHQRVGYVTVSPLSKRERFLKQPYKIPIRAAKAVSKAPFPIIWWQKVVRFINEQL